MIEPARKSRHRRARGARSDAAGKEAPMSMTLTAIRDELMGQHARLREVAAATRAAAERARAGEAGAREELGRHLGQLAEALEAHNLREEVLLGAIIRDLDAWGE